MVREELVLRLSWVNVVSSATQVIVQCTVYRTAKRRMRRAAICSRTIPSRNWRNTWKLQISACDQCLLIALVVQSVKAVVKYISIRDFDNVAGWNDAYSSCTGRIARC